MLPITTSSLRAGFAVLAWIGLTVSALAEEDPKRLVYFFTDCRKCREIEETIISRVPSPFEVVWADAESPRVLRELFSLAPPGGRVPPPAVYWHGRLYGDRDIQSSLMGDLLEYRDTGRAPADSAAPETRGGGLVTLFRSFHPGLIFLAGLADGINPCAFVTLLFFLTYLSTLRLPVRKMLLAGGVFIAAVFASYMAFGVAGFALVAWIRDTGARTLFSFLLLGLTAVLFVLSMFDFLQTLFAQNPNLFMKLPRSAVDRIHSRIRGAFPRGRFGEPSGFGLAAAAALTGAAVSSVELVCTGQIYLPVLKVIVQENEGLVRTRALLYLALYNAAFVLPLSALLVFYVGAGASGVTARLKTHAVFSRAAICLALAGLFALQVAYL